MWAVFQPYCGREQDNKHGIVYMYVKSGSWVLFIANVPQVKRKMEDKKECDKISLQSQLKTTTSKLLLSVCLTENHAKSKNL